MTWNLAGFRHLPPSSPPGLAAPLPLGHALALWGTSLLGMWLVSLAFLAFPGVPHHLPLFVGTVALLAVLLPSLAMCFWPWLPQRVELPTYRRPALSIVGVAVLVSFPLYSLSAMIFTTLGDGSQVTQASASFAGGAQTAWWSLLGLWLAYALLPAVSEELLYRGLLQSSLLHRWGPSWGITLTAALFACSHMEAAGILPRMLMGLWFGYLAWRTGSLWASTWAHAWNNTWGVLWLSTQGSLTLSPWLITCVSLACLAGAAWLLHRLNTFSAPVEGPAVAGPSGPRRLVSLPSSQGRPTTRPRYLEADDLDDAE
ncbi:MAG: type II CAAX endopeptidase family protein [Candidatus Sericytochromatia bacterium]|nr:type II CAAX endopeptidase family protein [Candidatus Sericytochromatia bacterium]